MATYDDNIQLDNEFTYQQYQSTPVPISNITNLGGAAPVISINGVDGPVVNFDGGVTGYSFSNGSNPITLSGAAASIRETSGPTVLTFGAITDGQFLKRVGTTVVSATPPSGYDQVQDEGVNITQRTVLNFTGAGVTASDVGGVTKVDIPGSAGGITELTGDVTAGPGSGSQAATLASIVAAAGPIGDGTHVAQVTIDAKGRVTALASVAITGAAPTGSAGGDLTGTYPNPSVANDAVTYAKMQNVSAASRVLGRGGAAGSGDVQELTLGSGLSMTGTQINASGGIIVGAALGLVEMVVQANYQM